MLDYSNIDKEIITLSPKEKAKELYDAFIIILPDSGDISKQDIQDCATTVVNEILKVVNPFKVSYWKKVKEEITQL